MGKSRRAVGLGGGGGWVLVEGSAGARAAAVLFCGAAARGPVWGRCWERRPAVRDMLGNGGWEGDGEVAGWEVAGSARKPASSFPESLSSFSRTRSVVLEVVLEVVLVQESQRVVDHGSAIIADRVAPEVHDHVCQRAALTSLDLGIGDEGAKALGKALEVNGADM